MRTSCTKKVEDRLRTHHAAHLPLMMGVLNVTPDSFFDGGAYIEHRALTRRISSLLNEGADIIDVGAESSRPGAPPVSQKTQIERLAPALAELQRRGAYVSVDTTSPDVAEYALKHGAQMLNDVSCLRDHDLADVAASYGAWLVITHSRKPMTEMSGFSQWPDGDYPDIVEEVVNDWKQAQQVAVNAGVRPERIIFDPGFGFSKNARHSLEALRRLSEFQVLGRPILAGTGRKSFISSIDNSTPANRLGGTVAASLFAATCGADILRVHDVHDVKQALLIQTALSPKPIDSARH